MKNILILISAALLASCSSVVYHGGQSGSLYVERLLMPPFVNATDDEHAGRALTEMMGSALVEAGIPLYQTEDLYNQPAATEEGATPPTRAELARSVNATHILVGTVHEYRYKTDLDGDPAVGITMRLVDAETGETVWQGSSGNVGYAFASLTSAAQKAVRTLVRDIPVSGNRMQDDSR